MGRDLLKKVLILLDPFSSYGESLCGCVRGEKGESRRGEERRRRRRDFLKLVGGNSRVEGRGAGQWTT